MLNFHIKKQHTISPEVKFKFQILNIQNNLNKCFTKIYKVHGWATIPNCHGLENSERLEQINNVFTISAVEFTGQSEIILMLSPSVESDFVSKTLSIKWKLELFKDNYQTSRRNCKLQNLKQKKNYSARCHLSLPKHFFSLQCKSIEPALSVYTFSSYSITDIKQCCLYQHQGRKSHIYMFYMFMCILPYVRERTTIPAKGNYMNSKSNSILCYWNIVQRASCEVFPVPWRLLSAIETHAGALIQVHVGVTKETFGHTFHVTRHLSGQLRLRHFQVRADLRAGVNLRDVVAVSLA